MIEHLNGDYSPDTKCPVCQSYMAAGNKFCCSRCAELGSGEEIKLSEKQEKIFEFIKLKYGTPCDKRKLRELQVDIKQEFGGI